jgi:hypothetical protein
MKPPQILRRLSANTKWPWRSAAVQSRLTQRFKLLEPDQLAEEIIETLEAGLNSFREVLAGLNKVA